MTSGCDNPSGKSTGRQAFSGVVWSFVERGSTQLLGFIVTVVMARLLTPSDYGLIGMLLIFLQIGEALASGGMTQALVARGIENRSDRRRAVSFNISAGILIYLLLWIAAPWIAGFYSEPLLTGLTRLVGLTVPLQAGACLPEAILMSRLAYRRRAVASLSALLIAGTTGILCAASGLGVLAIAIYMITQSLSLLLFLNIATAAFRPQATPDDAESTVRSKSLWKYGLNLIGARLADVAYINSYLIIIGRLLPVSDVGLFTRARQFASVPSISMSEIVRRVSYPVLCRVQDNENLRADYFKRMTGMAMCVAFPVMLVLAALAEPIVNVVLGVKWAGTGTLLIWLCLGMMWTPLDGLNLTYILASGNPSGLMKIEIIRKIIGLAVLLISFRFGLVGICIGYAAASFIAMAVTALYALRKLKGVSALLLKSVGLPLSAAVLTSTAVAIAASVLPSPLLKLIIGVAIAIPIYLFLLRIAGFRDQALIFSKLKDFLRRK